MSHGIANATGYRFHTSPQELLVASGDVKIGINGSSKSSNTAVMAISTILDFNARQLWMNTAIRV